MNETIPTPKLLDDEAKNAAEHRALLGKVTLEIEQILLRENLSVGDFLEIVGLFTARANSVFEKIKLSEVKKKYDG